MTSNEWRKIQLDEIINFNPRETIKKGTPAKKISMDQIQPFQREINGFEITEYKSGTKFRNGDTLFARITPCLENGKTAQVNVLEDGEVAFGSTEFIVLREVKGKSLNDYIYYLSMSPQFRELAIKSMTGTSGRQRAQKDVLESATFNIPPLSVQKSIAETLSSLDEKIETNNLINQKLEEMAKVMFKSWFVDFNFPDDNSQPYSSNGGEMVKSDVGLIPKGWKVGTLGEVAQLVGESYQVKNFENDVVPYIGLEHMPKGSISLTDWETSDKVSSSKTKFKKGDILFGKLRPYFKKVGMSPLGGICSTDILVINSIKENFFSYVMCLVSRDEFIDYCSATATGTRMPRTGWNQMSNYKILIPTPEVITEFHETIGVCFEHIQNLVNENATLKEIRDTLLPKLISGDIKVPVLKE